MWLLLRRGSQYHTALDEAVQPLVLDVAAAGQIIMDLGWGWGTASADRDQANAMKRFIRELDAPRPAPAEDRRSWLDRLKALVPPRGSGRYR
jgi:hypothetical protein